MMQSYNPATGDVIWEGNKATPKDIEIKIIRAQKAFHAWSLKPLEERVALLESYAKTLEREKEPFAIAISKETGKPLWESKTEVEAMIGKIPISIQSYHERCKRKELLQEAGTLSTEFRPHGIVAVFGPFNFPGHLPNGHIVPALLAGNTVLFKPSELTPSIGDLIEQYLNLPDGVFQVIHGGPKEGKLLASNPLIKGIFFTGSASVGHILKEENLKFPGRILALEMGGNNPLIISKVQDIKAAAYLTLQSAFITTGQRCTAARRLIITKDCQKKLLIKELIKQIETIKIGSYDDPIEPFMGPLISLASLKKLMLAQEELIKKGASILLPMRQLQEDLPFLTPGLVDVTSIERTDEEYFGPMLQIIDANSLEDAINIANDTEYGLSAGIFSDLEEEWKQFYFSIHAGIINWNSPTTGASSKAPFGGIGKSGNHRPSAFFAADYCSFPVASTVNNQLKIPSNLTPGIAT